MPSRLYRSERASSAVLAGVVVLVILNAWLAFQAEQILGQSEHWVAHTWEVMEHLQALLGAMEEAETGTRGYILTHDSLYLQPYHAALREYAGELDQVQFLTQDQPKQQARIAEVRAEVSRRLEILHHEVAMEAAGDHEGSLRLVHTGLGLSAMDKLRSLAAAMQQHEQGLLRARTARVHSAQLEARGTVAFASVLDVAFVVWAYFSIGRERRQRQQASETARRLEKLQALSDVALTPLRLDELIDELLGRLLRLAEVDAVTLLRRTEAGLEAVASAGFHLTSGRQLPVEETSALAESERERRVIRLDGEQVRSVQLPELAEAMGSVLIVPMALDGNVSGLVVAARREAYSFGSADEELLSLVADRIAAAIHRAALFDREQQARREAEAASAEVQLLNHELEERVRQRTAELETTNRELEAFSYSVSHDLRAPLRTVDGFSVALEEDFGAVLTGDGKHYLARIRNGVQRMGALIDALLQLSRITRAELTVEPVELSALATDVARGISEAHPDRAIEWAIEPGLATEGDPRLLRAVFENMLGNAAKFTAKLPVARIAFGWSPERQAFFIRDNGAGFDQGYAGKLFVAFQRLHGDKDFAGSGIGLATVARVIRRHHGRIWAEGAIGQGATFWFTLEASAS